MIQNTQKKIRQKDLEFVAQSSIPTPNGNLQIRAYRDSRNGSEPLAMFFRDCSGCENVPVRIHDACLTSEVLGSLKCDCKYQLDYSIKYIRQHGGIVIYLHQEGRGIGIANKIAAYSLQEEGLDTIEANKALHLPVDAREYSTAAQILRDLDIVSIQLLTNNPMKIQKLRNENIVIKNRLGIASPKNKFNQRYLETKCSQMGHFIE
jgi:GTP cyclohydrolase II